MKSTSIFAYIILTLIIGYVFIYPIFGDLSVLLSEKQKYNYSLEMAKNIENKKNELLAEFNNISAADKKSIETVLPNSLDFVRLVSQIDAVAANYGISISEISLKEISSFAGNSIEEAQPPKTYQSSMIGFSFDAPYDKFKVFLSELGKSLQILDIRSVKLDVKKGEVYSYNVEFETYWLEML